MQIIPRSVVSFPRQYIPYVITLCEDAKERCPFFPRTFKFLHWSFEDPAAAKSPHEEKLAEFRRVRDEITQRIDKELIATVVAERSGT